NQADESGAGMSQTVRALDVPHPGRLRPIMEVGKEFGLLESELISYGPYKAKISLDALKRLENQPDGRLVVVTAITPTRAGEGKTTSAISLRSEERRVGKEGRARSARKQGRTNMRTDSVE